MWNALAIALQRNPHPLYSVLRTLCPVFHDRRHHLWILFDYESVYRALNDHDAFSSRAAPPGGTPLDWLIFLDPPRHSRLRALVTRTFTPRSIAALEPRIRELATELIDEVVEEGAMDIVADIAEPLPLLVIAEMLGIPKEDRARFRVWSTAILHLGDTLLGGERAARALRQYSAAKQDMERYVGDLVARRQTAPADDLLTRLAQVQVDGERLRDGEILDFVQLLLLAGSETTTNLVGNAALTFLEHPDQFALIRTNSELLPQAIEEVLRYRSPVQFVFRASRRDVTMHRRTIPGGRLVLPLIGSANRDRRRFEHPNRFDISRSSNPHIAFGHGIHFCIGAALARVEARVVLSELVQRLDGLRPASKAPWQPKRALNILGPQQLRVTFAKGRRIGRRLDRTAL